MRGGADETLDYLGLLCAMKTGPFEIAVFRYVSLAGKGAESDEGIEVFGRTEGVHHQAGLVQ